MTPTPAELLTELKAAILCGTADITAAQEWCRALDVVIAAHVAASQSAAEGGGAQLLGRCCEALIWCSGSDDFQLEGKARVGWERLCVPLIDELYAALRGAGGK